MQVSSRQICPWARSASGSRGEISTLHHHKAVMPSAMMAVPAVAGKLSARESGGGRRMSCLSAGSVGGLGRGVAHESHESARMECKKSGDERRDAEVRRKKCRDESPPAFSPNL